MSTYLVVRRYGGPALLGVIALTVVASFLWYRPPAGEKGQGVSALPDATIESLAQMLTRDFRHVETRMNKTVWVLEAAVAEIFERKARLRRVKLTYYGDHEKPLVVTGRRALVDLEKWDSELFGDVRAVGRDGSVLKTSRLVWKNQAEQLLAPFPVRYRSEGLDLRGRSMLADLKKGKIVVTGRVKSVVRPPPGSLMPAAEGRGRS